MSLMGPDPSMPAPIIRTTRKSGAGAEYGVNYCGAFCLLNYALKIAINVLEPLFCVYLCNNIIGYMSVTHSSFACCISLHAHMLGLSVGTSLLFRL